MNKVWIILMIVSSVLLLFRSPDSIISEMLNASSKTVVNSIELFSIYAVWLGIMEIVERTGLSTKLANFLSPGLSKLFRTNNKEAQKYIAINISANLLGLGNAATPSAINAMKVLDDKSGKPVFAMVMLIVINSLSIELIPSTTIALRAANGSSNPSSILIPTLLATTCSTLCGVLLVFLFDKIKRRKQK